MCTARNVNPTYRLLSVRHNSGVGCLMSVSAGTMGNPTCVGGAANGRIGSFRGNSRASALVHARGNGAVLVRRGIVAPHPCDHVCRMMNTSNCTDGCPVRRCYVHPARVTSGSMPGRRGLGTRNSMPTSIGGTLVSGCGRPVRGRLRRATGGMNKRNNVSCVVSCHLICYLHGNLPLSVSICSLTR